MGKSFEIYKATLQKPQILHLDLHYPKNLKPYRGGKMLSN